MPELKKIDYRELSKETPQQTQQGTAPAVTPEQQPQQPAASEKASFFGSLANKWSLMDKKMKIEVFVLIVVIAAIIAVAVYYFSNTKSKYIIEELHAPGAEQSIDEL